ncbi:Carboxylesterase Culp1 [Fulvia fulva]|uniref:Carboxylesterase Culp1 n=1 Tax=Passalora fulva TaxID=5499 RepID=A0A1P8YXS3_PASFU|nr:Carboxylesterase Culp1 [Fulvia fulva]AQA29319.1 hypothetical protein 26 [Fulvia fulva]KAK4623980.1 Carboxylesterase Culp1 [Fulvia fulva]KAK4624830.1 Carboxylesterase Culp1 [Fulvia fulva]UJO18208.1 Carboxylesterase Culp1 [Fulvia fulva]WPV14768.1 Carboxylesterase Culp1 [Fulvia fulva]
MHPLTLATLASTLALASAACNDYTLINARGTGELQGESIGFRTMIDQVLAAVPNGSIYNVVYPAAPDITQQTTSIGSSDIARFIQTGLSSCPQQRYVLLGYSQGATVVNRALQAFPPTSRQGQAISAVVQIGNPYHLPDRRGNVDDMCGTSTAGASGALLATSDYEVPEGWYGTGRVRDICYEGDGVCMGFDAGNVFSGSHLFYGFSQSVADCGSGFIVEKLG